MCERVYALYGLYNNAVLLNSENDLIGMESALATKKMEYGQVNVTTMIESIARGVFLNFRSSFSTLKKTTHVILFSPLCELFWFIQYLNLLCFMRLLEFILMEMYRKQFQVEHNFYAHTNTNKKNVINKSTSCCSCIKYINLIVHLKKIDE